MSVKIIKLSNCAASQKIPWLPNKIDFYLRLNLDDTGMAAFDGQQAKTGAFSIISLIPLKP